MILTYLIIYFVENCSNWCLAARFLLILTENFSLLFVFPSFSLEIKFVLIFSSSCCTTWGAKLLKDVKKHLMMIQRVQFVSRSHFYQTTSREENFLNLWLRREISTFFRSLNGIFIVWRRSQNKFAVNGVFSLAFLWHRQSSGRALCWRCCCQSCINIRNRFSFILSFVIKWTLNVDIHFYLYLDLKPLNCVRLNRYLDADLSLHLWANQSFFASSRLLVSIFFLRKNIYLKQLAKAIIFTVDYTWPISDNGNLRSIRARMRSSIMASLSRALQRRSRDIINLLFIVIAWTSLYGKWCSRDDVSARLAI